MMLAKIPASSLNQMILDLPTDASAESFSDVMSGKERLVFLRKMGKTSSSTHTLLRKLRRMTSPDRVFVSHQVTQSMPITPNDFSAVKFSARNYIDSGSVAVRGRIRALALPENAVLFIIEFSSRSPYYRRFYRYLIGQSFFLMEQKENAMKLFNELIHPLLVMFDFNPNPNPISPKHFERALHSGPPILEMELEVQDPAVPNLTALKLTGDNLARGIKTLHSRQEVDVFKICSKIVSIKIPDLTISLDGVTIRNMAPIVLKTLSHLFGDSPGSV
ncbi:MAG: hypothetical protein ACXACI_05680 [Candidatus Hodarchaeales archaeon]|jgi:hypothetical protein